MTAVKYIPVRRNASALLLAAALLGAGLPASADEREAGTTSPQVERVTPAPFKMANRFHHRNVTQETAEFARFEEADDAVSDSRRRPFHKAPNRFHNVD